MTHRQAAHGFGNPAWLFWVPGAVALGLAVSLVVFDLQAIWPIAAVSATGAALLLLAERLRNDRRQAVRGVSDAALEDLAGRLEEFERTLESQASDREQAYEALLRHVDELIGRREETRRGARGS